MVKELLNKIRGTQKYLSIEIQFIDDTKEYRSLVIEKKDTNLNILSSQTYSDFESLINESTKSLPVVLSFTGNGIISKKVERTPNYRSKLLFNANADDFYWYELEQSNHIYASVIRNSVIEHELSEFNKNQFFVVEISIGPFILSSIKPLLPNTSKLHTKNFKLEFDNKQLVQFEKFKNVDASAHYEIGDEKIALDDIVPFASLLNYLFSNSQLESENGFLQTSREEFKYRKAFNTIGMIALPTFLVTLLASYLLMGFYQSQYIELQVQIEEESIAYNKLVLLESDRANKEAILKESGLNNSNFLSFYISEITKNVPVEINLSELEVFSPKEKIKANQRISFHNDTIEIMGETTSNEAFADWIKKIKSYKWIENLEIVDFRKMDRTSNFLIRLKLSFNV